MIEHLSEYIDPLEYFNRYVAGCKAGVKELSDSYPSTICPFHEDTDPSFHWYRRKGRFTCFGACHWGGSVLRLHRDFQRVYCHNHMSEQEALLSLLKMYKLTNLLDTTSAEAKQELSAYGQYLAQVDLSRYSVKKGVMTLNMYKDMNEFGVRGLKSGDITVENAVEVFDDLDTKMALINSEVVSN